MAPLLANSAADISRHGTSRSGGPEACTRRCGAAPRGVVWTNGVSSEQQGRQSLRCGRCVAHLHCPDTCWCVGAVLFSDHQAPLSLSTCSQSRHQHQLWHRRMNRPCILRPATQRLQAQAPALALGARTATSHGHAATRWLLARSVTRLGALQPTKLCVAVLGLPHTLQAHSQRRRCRWLRVAHLAADAMPSVHESCRLPPLPAMCHRTTRTSCSWLSNVARLRRAARYLAPAIDHRGARRGVGEAVRLLQRSPPPRPRLMKQGLSLGQGTRTMTWSRAECPRRIRWAWVRVPRAQRRLDSPVLRCYVVCPTNCRPRNTGSEDPQRAQPRWFVV